MAAAFISYSRTDLDFVRELVADLENRGVDVWVDFDDTPPAAPWADELTDHDSQPATP